MKVCAVINRDVAAGLVGRRDGGAKWIRIFGRGALEAEKPRAAGSPAGIAVGNLRPRRAEVRAGIVVFPDVGDRQQIDDDTGHVGHGRGASVRSGIGPACGRLQEIDQCVAPTRTAALSDIGALRAVIDHVDRAEVRVRKNDDSDVGIQFEVHVVGALARITVRDEREIAAAGDETQRRNRAQRRRARGIGKKATAKRDRQRAGIE